MSSAIEGFKITSSLTLFYRIVIPYGVLTIYMGLIVGAIFVFPGKYYDLYLIGIPVSGLVWFLMLHQFTRLRDAYLNGDEIIIVDGRKIVTKAMVKDAVSIKKQMMTVFFELELPDKKVLLLPKARESFMTLGIGMPPSVKLLKDKMMRAKSN